VETFGDRVVISDINGGLYVLDVILREEQCLADGGQRFGFANQEQCLELFNPLPGAVTDLAASAVSASEIELTFSAVGSDGSEPPPAGEYVVKQALTPITDQAAFDAARTLCDQVCTFTPEDVGDPISLTVADLDPDTSYHYAVRARNDAGGLGPLSQSVQATTLSGVPGAVPGAVRDLAASALSRSEVELTFSAPDSGRSTPAGEFVVKQALTPIDDEADFAAARTLCGEACTFSPASVGDEITLTVTDLDPGTTYHYALRARIDSGALGPISNPAQATTPTSAVVRVAGATRIETAVEVSRARFGDGEAGAVVLARADAFPDALAGTPLAVALDAPLLLTAPAALDQLSEAELVRVLPPGGTVYLLGAPVALSAEVESRVRELGYQVVRYGGANRFATAVTIAEQGLGDPPALLIASGADFPDALAAGAAGERAGAAVVLTDGRQMAPETAGYLDRRPDTERFAVGGPAAAAAPDANPIVGATRFETAIAVADAFFDAPTAVGVATGASFPDALAGGAQIGALGGPMLLSAPDELPLSVRDYLAVNNATIERGILYGGPAALSDAVQAAVAGALE